jgi:hypothetical protein
MSGSIHLYEQLLHGCGTVLRILDVYPGSRVLIFTHPGFRIQKQQLKRGVKKKFVVIPFFAVTNCTKMEN